MLLARYGITEKELKCPADKRVGRYQGTNATLRGTRIPAARTFAMSQAVGTIDPGFASGSGHSGVPNQATKGPWLSNSHGSSHNYRTFGKDSDFESAAMTWVLVDEDQYSLNDAGFAVGVRTPEWIDFPGTYHNNACGFAFADGHSEIHKWKDARTRVVNKNVARKAVPNSVDWQWIAERTTQTK